jgi:hypothetical protein
MSESLDIYENLLALLILNRRKDYVSCQSFEDYCIRGCNANLVDLLCVGGRRFHQTMWHHIPVSSYPCNYRHENLKFHISLIYFQNSPTNSA